MANRLANLLDSIVEATATPYPVDRYLELIDPMLTWREARAKIVEIRRQTDRSATIRLRPTRQWEGHRAGQYVEVSTVIEGVRHRRYFSPASTESHGKYIELTVTAHEDGFISKHLVRDAKVGDVLGLSAAQGEFVLPEQRPEHTVLISGGSGITPVISMLRTLLAEGHEKPITFVHYARTPVDVPYRAELEAIGRTYPNVDIALHYTRIEDSGDGANGYFTPAHLDGIADAPGAQLFLCGPPALMSAVREYHESAGLAAPLHSEAFVIEFAPVADPNEPVHGTIEYTKSGTSSENDGRTILEQAEDAGLNPEYGCRMGICFSCTKVRKTGCTRNVLTGELDSEPDQHIQICVSAPVGDVEIEV